MKRHCALADDERAFFEKAAELLQFSPRGCQRVLKVARTITDLNGEPAIAQARLAEAIGFRQPGCR